MCPTIVSTGKTERVVAKQPGRESEERVRGGTRPRERERDHGEVSTLQQETLQSAFNHSEAPPPPSLQTERRMAAQSTSPLR